MDICSEEAEHAAHRGKKDVQRTAQASGCSAGSMKSDGSKPEGSKLWSGLESVSMKSNRSQDEGPMFSPEPGPGSQSGVSAVSMKSDHSRGEPLTFSPEPGPASQVQGLQDLSQTQLDAIFMRLEEEILAFVKQQLQTFHRLLTSEITPESTSQSTTQSTTQSTSQSTTQSTSQSTTQSTLQSTSQSTTQSTSQSTAEEQSRDAVLNITLDFLRRMDQEVLAQRLTKGSVNVCREELKSHLKHRFSQVFEGVAKAGDSVPLQQIYTELYIVEGGASEVNQEHEVRHIESMSRRRAERVITCEDMFKKLPESEPIRVVLTKGVAGVGKTVLTQKFSLDWAEDRAHQDVQLLFPFTFRELNVLRDAELSLEGLVHHFFSQAKDLHSFKDLQLLFILDGLDECRLPLDFSRTRQLTEPTESASVEELLVNLIRGILLPSAHLWITTRPAAANQIPAECVSMVTEVRGFTDKQKEQYFWKRFTDEAPKVISHIKSVRSLFIMCNIPIFSWILSTVLQKILEQMEEPELPKTLTQMYIHFLVVQAKVKNIKYHEGTGADRPWTQETREMVKSLGKLAFEQLLKGNLIFYKSDVSECGLDAEEIARYSGVFTQVFREEPGLYQDKVYCFIHLSVHEFLAALHVNQAFFSSGENLLSAPLSSDPEDNLLSAPLSSDPEEKLLSAPLSSKMLVPVPTLEEIFYSSGENLSSPPHSSKSNMTHSAKQLSKKSTQSAVTPHSSENLKSIKVTSKQSSFMTKLNQRRLKRTTADPEDNPPQATGSSDRERNRPSLSQTSKTPVPKPTPEKVFYHSAVDPDPTPEELFYRSAVDRASQSPNGHLDLFLRFLLGLSLPTNQRLLQGLLMETGSDLTNQRTVKYIKKKLDERDVSAERSLNLVHCLSELNDRSLVEEIQEVMRGGSLSDRYVSPAQWSTVSFLLLSSDSDLEHFDLRKYCPSEEGLLGLLPVIRASTKVTLSSCGLTSLSCGPDGPLASLLSSSSLTILDLSNNDLQDSGVELLCEGLKSAPCRLETLRLSGCMVSERGGAYLAAALSSAPFQLRELDLRYNHPGSSREKLTTLKASQRPVQTFRLDPAGEKFMVLGLRKYACEFSLERNTAHSRLLLSEDLRSVTHMKKDQSYPDHIDRFTDRPQVLSSSGLRGRCYWEVDWSVRGWCIIAVSYRGISRSGEGRESGFGGTDRSWSLRINEEGDRYVCHNSNITLLPGKEGVSSGRVGVFLDWEGGALCFYDVTDGGHSHLYTFSSSFTEELFPGFALWEPGSSVTVVDLTNQRPLQHDL